MLNKWLTITKQNQKRNYVIFLIFLLLSIIMVFCATYLLYSGFNNGTTKYLRYDETSNLNYKVWLKTNDFYEEDYLEENYDIVATAIDNIEIDFNYLLKTSDYINGKSYYVITSYIQAYQKADVLENKVWNYRKVIKDKTITLYDEKTTEINIQDDFKIDYQAYREMMDNYKNNYAVSLVGNLVIEIEIKNDLNYTEFKNAVDLSTRKMSIVIPLTDSIITITKNSLENNHDFIVEKQESKMNYIKIFASIIIIVLDFVLIVNLGINLVRLLGIDSRYVKELRKILRTYDSVIVNVKEIKLNDECVMYVDKFEELLDAQAELRVPILYCNVVNNKEAMFAIKNGKDVFVYKMKSTLYEKERKKS